MSRVTTYITSNGVEQRAGGSGSCVIEAPLALGSGGVTVNGYPVAVDDSALYIAEWHINALTGSDVNDGKTATTALASHAELSRRIGYRAPRVAAVDVYLDSDIDEIVVLTWMTSTTITYHGTRKILYSGVISGHQAFNPATSTVGMLTDAGIPTSYTLSGLVQKHAVLTTGANAGAIGIIIKDMAAKTARYAAPWWIATSFGGVDPAVTDHYDVYNLTTVMAIVNDGSAAVSFYDIDVDAVGLGPYDFCINIISGQMRFFGCTIRGNGVCWSLQGAVYAAVLFTATADWQPRGGYEMFWNCAFEMRFNTQECEGMLAIETPCSTQNTAAIGGNDGVLLEYSAWWAFFDMNTAYALRVGSGALRRQPIGRIDGLIWGVNNTLQYGIKVGTGCCLMYTTLPTLGDGTNSVADVLVGDQGKGYDQLPFVDSPHMAGMVLDV